MAANGLMPSAPQPSSLDPCSDNKVASGDSKMTLRASGKPCSSLMVSRPNLALLGASTSSRSRRYAADL